MRAHKTKYASRWMALSVEMNVSSGSVTLGIDDAMKIAAARRIAGN
jgi:hypothetical protein